MGNPPRQARLKGPPAPTTIPDLRPGADPIAYEATPYRPERVRAQLAFAPTTLLALTVAFVAVQVARGYREQTREFAEVILAGELTLLGSAVSFYVGAQHQHTPLARRSTILATPPPATVETMHPRALSPSLPTLPAPPPKLCGSRIVRVPPAYRKRQTRRPRQPSPLPGGILRCAGSPATAEASYPPKTRPDVW